MRGLLDWLEERAGIGKMVRAALYENIPGGARWRYAWGTALAFSFFTQAATGIVLWSGYAPSAQTAWESVFYMQTHMQDGWFLRGLHHYNAQALTILVVLHFLQMIVDGADKAPRELNFWFGLLLVFLVLAASVTGWLLPWDQRGFWATKVPTNLLAITPLVGPALQRILVGGPEFGHATLTRFFALHAGVLPGAFIVVGGGYVWLLRRHGRAVGERQRGLTAVYWPDQALRDAVVCLAVMAALVALVMRHHGAALGAPADPTANYSAARPEWFFLFLYQFLKYFPGGTEVVGAILIPGVFFTLLFLMPFTGRTRIGHRFNLCLVAGAGVAAIGLTCLALAEDRANPAFLAARKQADVDAARAQFLAQLPAGIPAEGAISLMRQDPLTQGPRLFARYCASCHRYAGGDGLGGAVADAPSASELRGFGSREWLAGLLDPAQVAGPHYFGGTALKNGKMIKFVKNKVSQYTPEQQADLRKVLAAVSAEAALPAQREPDAAGAADIQAGAALLSGAINCADCHAFRQPDPNATAPDLTGFGSREWLTSFIGNPKQDRFYGEDNDRMPAFLAEKILTPEEIGLLADWLRGSWPGNDASTPAR